MYVIKNQHNQYLDDQQNWIWDKTLASTFENYELAEKMSSTFENDNLSIVDVNDLEHKKTSIEKKIDERLLNFINKNLFKTNGILEKAILISLIPSFYITKNGFFVIRNIKSNEDLTIKYLFRNYFPKTPTIVSKKSFEKLALNKTIYYRGVYKKEYIQNFIYGTGTSSFSGRGQDMYTGTWITNKKDYATRYHFDNNPMRILLKSNIKIATEEKAYQIQMKYLNKIKIFEKKFDKISSDSIQDKLLRFQIKYFSENFLKTTIVLILEKFDGILMRSTNDDVYVIFDKNKLIVEN